MGIEEFAGQRGLRVKRDPGGERYIPCRNGQIYAHGGLFGDAEVCLTFDPSNEELCGLVIRVLGARRERQDSSPRPRKASPTPCRCLQDSVVPRLECNSRG
jgi:hypothetical protein